MTQINYSYNLKIVYTLLFVQVFKAEKKYNICYIKKKYHEKFKEIALTR